MRKEAFDELLNYKGQLVYQDIVLDYKLVKTGNNKSLQKEID